MHVAQDLLHAAGHLMRVEVAVGFVLRAEAGEGGEGPAEKGDNLQRTAAHRVNAHQLLHLHIEAEFFTAFPEHSRKRIFTGVNRPAGSDPVSGIAGTQH